MLGFIQSFDWNNILEGVDIEAFKIAMDNNLGSTYEIRSAMNRKKSTCLSFLENISEIEQYLK
ncbi:hypothetical protein IAI10_04465 [Clostridium sp. 19966]|uniref:hypothetical protein n=1 Tax=Clostridium sp. 19966 TaxID=2768166 RepID=UPI0028DE8DB3|nr:hypothetical protein [Clostridium sp. 19966]MDT8715899.1 hypothetical protein [Clostridium sp. 19966]